MQRKLKRSIRVKFLILPFLIAFLFSLFKIGTSLASIDKLIITGAEISFESETVETNNFKYEKHKIISDTTFHKVGDSITYTIKIKNNDEKNYILKSISDDNTNKYVSYTYDMPEEKNLNSQDELTFTLTEKYTQEITDLLNREQDFSVNIIFTLVDENENETQEEITIDPSPESPEEPKSPDSPANSSTSNSISANPNTSDDILVYTTTAVLSIFLMIVLSKSKSSKSKHSHVSKHRKTKLFSLIIVGALMVPLISKAANDNFIFEFVNKISLKDKLIFTYVIGDTEYEEIVSYGEKATELEDLQQTGYIFKGWQKDDGTLFNIDTEIKNDEKVTAIFEPIQYTIDYELNGGNVSDTNPSTYTIESDDITLNNPTKEGYEFTGWTGTDLNEKIENVSIFTGSTGNRSYTANWVESNYSINYHLNGGTVSGNPISYNISTDDITLNNPIKDGYEFTGWTGTGLNEITKTVTIPKGSIGEKEYTANWEAITYTITYKGITDEEKTNLNNPETYNIETDNITLNNPQDRKDSDGDITEKFVGWKENISTSINITIETGTFGNKTYKAVWETVDPNTYTIEYDLDKGTLTTENPTSFTKFTNTFTLNNPSKTGYTFIGWTGSNGDTPELTVKVNKGTRENLRYKANWEEITYSIAYNLNGGNVETENPTTYTINTDSITLNNPSKTGYTFAGWTGTDLAEKTMEVNIPNKSVGNRTYTANWIANTYEIVFDKNTGKGSMANQEMTYDVSSALSTNLFSKIGFTFTKWNTQADGNGTSYTDKEIVNNLATDGELTLYAQWKLNDNTVAEVNGTTYNSLQKAIDAVPTTNTQTTVTLLTNTSENVKVKANQNIVFDFQNFTLKNDLNDSQKNAIITNNGTIKISNGTIETNSTTAAAINNNESGNITIAGGQIKVVDANSRQAIYNDKGTVTICDEAYLSSISTIRACVQNISGGTLTITGGQILQNVSTNQPGVNNAGVLTIGKKDGNVSKTSPTIQGSNYGITSSSDFSFYDGIVTGKQAINNEEKVTDIETNNVIYHSTETIDSVELKTVSLRIEKTVTFNPNYDDSTITTKLVEYNTPVGTLPKLPRAGFTFDGWFTDIKNGDKITENTIISDNITFFAHWTEINTAQIGDTKYRTLAAAIAAVPTTNVKTTISLLNNTDENIKITSNKNIVLNLKNYTINNNSSDAIITNEGTLAITNGTLTSSSEKTATINNNKNAKLKLYNVKIIATGTRQALYNNCGTVEISDGAYLSSNPVGKQDSYTLDRGTVQNIGTGTVTITGGTIINTMQQAVSNEGTLIIGKKDSNINASSPILIGKDHGVRNISTFKFYDGIIKGYTAALEGDITEIEDNSETVSSTEVIDGLTYKTIYLKITE